MTMKKNLLFLASAVVALMMSSCVKDTTNDITPGSGATHTITASIEAMTRTSMNDMEVGETSQIVWSSGDKIGLVKEDGSIVPATINAASVGKAVGEFTVSDTDATSAKYIYAFYPYQSDVKYADGKLSTVRLNAKRNFIKNAKAEDGSVLQNTTLTFATNQMPMVAKADANGNLVFKSTCGIIELQLTASTSQNFYNFTIHSDSKELSDYGSVDLTADEPTFVPYHMAAYNGNTISNKQYGTHSAYMMGADNNNKGVNVGKDTPTKLFFVVPIGTYNDLQIQVARPELCVTKKSSKSHTVKRNTILAFKPFDVCAVDNIYGGDDVTDLSADGVANTYLVPTSNEPKKYKFTALMEGNTKDFKLPDGTTLAIKTKTDGTTYSFTNQNYNTTFVYAEDSEGVVQNLRREGSTIYFTASKPGNAIIMIGSTSIERVNQFHIWVSDAEDQELPGGHVFLNCNLGATYVPTTLEEAKAMKTNKEKLWRAAGCLYQWGNPTPRPSMTPNFIPANYTSTGNVANADWVKYSGWIIHPWAIGPDAGYSMRHMSSATEANELLRSRMYFNFYGLTSSTYADGKVTVWWHTDKDKYGDLRFGKNALWQSKKTQFDPCPPGYRVPSKQEMVEAFTNDGTNKGKQYKRAVGAAGQYYEYNGQFVFISWSGLRQATDAELLNPAFTNYARCGFWFFDENLTQENMLTDYPTGGCYMDYNGTDMYTNSTNNTLNVGNSSVYPAIEVRGGGSGHWAGAYQTEGNATNPALQNYRYPVNTGMGIRCVRDSKAATPSSVAASYEVDGVTGF